jgi:alanyl aminopeptidase
MTRPCSAPLLLTLACLLIASSSASAAGVPTGRLPRDVVPQKVGLELRIDPAGDGLSGRALIEVDVARSTDTFWLHGRDLTIERAQWRTDSGEVLPLQVEVADAAAGVLKVQAPAALATGHARLEIDYSAPYGRNMQGAYKVRLGEADYVLTQMEPLGARSAFPGFDEPSFKTPWEISLVVPETMQAFANTTQIGKDKVQDGWKKLRFAPTEKLPSYLVAFAVGEYDVVPWADIPPNAVRKTPLPLRGIAAKGRGKDMGYALRNTAQIVAALEAYFDTPYPFDKLDLLAAPDFSFGAMENAGLIVYRDTLLLNVDRAPTLLRQNYWGTHTHELAHQWFGNLVTMPWWDDIWLNEAFATWMAAKVVHELKPEFHADRKLLEASLAAMAEDSLAATRRIHEPVHDHTDALAAFDGITYQKGGAMLSMFESYLGPERFRAAVRAHMRQFARANATSGDLMRSLAARSDQASALQEAFASFTDQPGVPFLRTRLDCEGGKAALAIEQSRYLPLGSGASAAQRWSIPVCVRYAQGGATRRQCELVDAAQDRIELAGTGCPAWVHPNADGAGYYRFALAPDDQRALDAGFAALNEREQRVHADSLVAAYRSGALSNEAFLAASARLAGSEVREVALAPAATLEWMVEHAAVDAAQREALRAWIVRTYQPRLDALGLDARSGDGDEVRLLRKELIRLLVDLGRAPALRATLAARGRRVLGMDGDGTLQADAVESDQRDVALQMAAELGGEAEFDAMQRHLRASQDSLLRGQLLWAMGSASSEALRARARALALDVSIKSGEVSRLIFPQFRRPESRAEVRTWFRANFEPLFVKVPLPFQSNLPGWDAWEMCSEDAAKDLDARYRERMAKVEAGPRTLAQTTEEVRLCATLRAHHARGGFGSMLAP